MANILIIDDEPAIRKLLMVMFQDAGYTIFQASNGLEATKIVKTNKIDVMITDVVMPEQGGLETIMQLKNSYPDMKVIVISGKVAINNDAFQNLIKQYRVARVFDKPFDKDEVIQAVKELIGDT